MRFPEWDTWEFTIHLSRLRGQYNARKDTRQFMVPVKSPFTRMPTLRIDRPRQAPGGARFYAEAIL
jgi:hypothetical protein